VLEMWVADGSSLGAVSVEVDGASLRPGDDTGGSLWDLVTRGTGLGMPGSVAPGDTILALVSLGAAGLGVAELPLADSPGFALPPIGWRQVEDDVDFQF
jgi:hypothetical protein